MSLRGWVLWVQICGVQLENSGVKSCNPPAIQKELPKICVLHLPHLGEGSRLQTTSHGKFPVQDLSRKQSSPEAVVQGWSLCNEVWLRDKGQLCVSTVTHGTSTMGGERASATPSPHLLYFQCLCFPL